MRRLIVLFVGLVALGGLLVAGRAQTENAPLAPVAAPAVVEPRRQAPEPRFSRTIYAATDLNGSTKRLDACKGPVAVWLGDDRPTLVAEHDYCGGSFWMSKLKVGEAVQLGGIGVDDGLFVVTSLKYETRKEVTVGDLPEADVVLQTCVTKTRLVLVAMERYEA